MPVTYLHIKWPDDTSGKIYSPSSIIGEYFEKGETIGVQEFDDRISKALEAAIQRVINVYGFECSAARAELSEVKETLKKYDRDGKSVEVIRVG